MSESLKPGDLVLLKSGSPMLTVQREENEQGYVEVVWIFDGEACETLLPPACLVRVDP